MTRRSFIVRSFQLAAGAVALSAFGAPLTPTVVASPGQTRIRDLRDDRPLTTGVRELPEGTTHVGIHWRGQGHADARLRVRTSVDGQRWSKWLAVAKDEVPFKGEETFGTLVDVRGARFVEYRLDLPAGGSLERVTVTTIDAGGGAGEPRARAAGPSGSFTTLDGKSRAVYTRADWGCDESLGQDAQGNRAWLAMFVPTKKVIVHHTATGNRYADGAAEVRAVYAYHAVSQGWGDIGYQALVDRFGNFYEGRRGREGSPREILSSGVVAGQCLGFNYGTSGVAVLGDFTKRKISTSNADDRAMLLALEDFIVYECGRAGLAPGGASDFLRSDNLWRDGLPTIVGHKDALATQCPGGSLYTQLATLRKNAVTRLGPFGTPTTTLTVKPLRQVSSPPSLTFAWSGDGESSSYRLEGWRKINPAGDIDYWAPSGWTPTEPSGWMAAPTANGQVSFDSLVPAHYTFHVRGHDAVGKPSAVQADWTVLVV